MQFKTFLTISAAALALGAGAATAQTVDYESLQELFGEPATTSAIGQPQRLSDAPVNMSIVTADEIRRSGLRTIPDIIDRLAGVSVTRAGATAAEVHIRGYNRPSQNRLLVLMNGRQVYFDSYGYNVWSAIPVQLEEIQQIEVVRGPNAALFGFNAVAGVVNIVTKNPLYNNENAVTARVGSGEYLEGAAVLSRKVTDSVGVRLSLGGATSDEWDFPGVVPDDRRASRVALNSEVMAQLSDTVQLGFEATYADIRRSSLTSSGGREFDDHKNASARLSLHADTDYGLMTFRAYHNWTESDYSSAAPWQNNTTVIQLSDVFKIGVDDTFRLGVEFRNNSMDAIDTTGAVGSIGYQVYSGAAMWNHTFSEKLSAVAAVRYDYLSMSYDGRIGSSYLPTPPASPIPFTPADYDRSFGTLSFNLGALWKPTERDTVRATVSRAAVLPSLIEFGAFQFQSFYSDPRVDPTMVTNFELGYDRKIDAINGGMRLSAFYTINEDVRDQVLLGRLFGVVSIQNNTGNVGDSHLTGVELGFNGQHSDVGVFDTLRWNANVTGYFVKDDLSGGNNLSFEKSTPEFEVEAGVGASVGKWDFDLAGRFLSGHYRNIDDGGATVRPHRKIDPFFTVNASAAYHLTEDVTARLSFEQIGETSVGQSGSSSNEQRVFFTIGARF